MLVVRGREDELALVAASFGSCAEVADVIQGALKGFCLLVAVEDGGGRVAGEVRRGVRVVV